MTIFCNVLAQMGNLFGDIDFALPLLLMVVDDNCFLCFLFALCSIFLVLLMVIDDD